MNCLSPTQSIVYQLATRHHGCTLAANWNLKDHAIVRRKTDRISEWQRLCVVQNVGQITGLISTNSTCAFGLTATTRQESVIGIGRLQADTRQQDANIHQWYLQPFRCTGTQFRGSRWDVSSLHWHRSLFINGFPRTSISQTPRLFWWDWRINPGAPWRETPNTQSIPQWYQLSI